MGLQRVDELLRPKPKLIEISPPDAGAERTYFRTADQVAGFAGRMTRIQSHGLDSLSDSKIRGAGLEGQTPIPLE